MYRARIIGTKTRDLQPQFCLMKAKEEIRISDAFTVKVNTIQPRATKWRILMNESRFLKRKDGAFCVFDQITEYEIVITQREIVDDATNDTTNRFAMRRRSLKTKQEEMRR